MKPQCIKLILLCGSGISRRINALGRRINYY